MNYLYPNCGCKVTGERRRLWWRCCSRSLEVVDEEQQRLGQLLILHTNTNTALCGYLHWDNPLQIYSGSLCCLSSLSLSHPHKKRKRQRLCKCGGSKVWQTLRRRLNKHLWFWHTERQRLITAVTLLSDMFVFPPPPRSVLIGWGLAGRINSHLLLLLSHLISDTEAFSGWFQTSRISLLFQMYAYFPYILCVYDHLMVIMCCSQ